MVEKGKSRRRNSTITRPSVTVKWEDNRVMLAKVDNFCLKFRQKRGFYSKNGFL